MPSLRVSGTMPSEIDPLLPTQLLGASIAPTTARGAVLPPHSSPTAAGDGAVPVTACRPRYDHAAKSNRRQQSRGNDGGDHDDDHDDE